MKEKPKDKCMVANCEGIPIVCIQHVEAARKEGYERGKQDEKNAWRIVGNWSKELESARKESFENGRIVGFEVGLIDELVEKRVEKARKEGTDKANEAWKKAYNNLKFRVNNLGRSHTKIPFMVFLSDFEMKLAEQGITLEKKEVK